MAQDYFIKQTPSIPPICNSPNSQYSWCQLIAPQLRRPQLSPRQVVWHVLRVFKAPEPASRSMLEFHYILTVERIIHRNNHRNYHRTYQPQIHNIRVVSIDCPPAPTTTAAPTPGCLICPAGHEGLIIGFSEHA